ncbi:MAG TPA: hypothetical protein VNV86_04260 [Candidatus Acidoferrum sp.]|nr:hypothetical protein [Candidatus Acidoferrum sp.]
MAALRVLLGALLTVAVCLAIGRMILREASRDWGARFVVGAAGLSTAVFGLCALRVAYPWVMIVGGLALIVASRASKGDHRAGILFIRPSLLWIPFAAYLVFYFCHALAPEASPDGAGYHLGLVIRYLHEHGFVRITDNMYAAMPGGIEMLYLFAYPIGGGSAAALVHLAFLIALVWQLYRWSPAAALLVMVSPVIGIDATSAYNDVALAAIAFTLFHLIERWREQGGMRLATAIGLLAGFALATKYTAALAIPYAVAIVAWRNRRAALVTSAAAALVCVPWLIKNWIYLQNPVSPFFNRIFPNPYVMVSFEDTYRHMLATYGLPSRWSIPWEATTPGGLSGILGPVFLLAPLGLLALRRAEGRRVWLIAIVFGATYFGNIGTRFLIPVAPFLALALMLALASVPRVALAIALLSAVISWPALVPRYARSDTWRLDKFPWREALRIRTPDHYLDTHLIGYGIDRLIEERTRPGSTVFTFTPIPEAYTSRRIRVEYQAAENKIAGALLWTATEPSYLPTWRLRFTFPRQSVQGLRLVQSSSGAALWTIHELRVFDGASELAREPDWRLTAQPYPWGITNAFDNSLATFWMCGEFLRPGQFVQAAFGRERQADAVVMESSPNQTGLRLRLEGREGAGEWRLLSDAPTISDVARPLGLRRAVTSELKRRGIDYVLLFDGQVGADDFRQNADLWNAAPVGDYKGARLYELR